MAFRKFGLESFIKPPYKKVTPKKSRRGIRAHSLSAQARTGALKGSRRRLVVADLDMGFILAESRVQKPDN